MEIDFLDGLKTIHVVLGLLPLILGWGLGVWMTGLKNKTRLEGLADRHDVLNQGLKGLTELAKTRHDALDRDIGKLDVVASERHEILVGKVDLLHGEVRRLDEKVDKIAPGERTRGAGSGMGTPGQTIVKTIPSNFLELGETTYTEEIGRGTTQGGR